MTEDRKKQILFMLTQTDDGLPMLVFGVTEEAWNHMRNGKTHNFDFNKAGLPIRVCMFGAKDHKEAMKFMDESAKAAGVAILDERHADFNINPLDTSKTKLQ